jgi:hypothetical protein
MSALLSSPWSGLLGTTFSPSVKNCGPYPSQTVQLGKRVRPAAQRQSAERKNLYLIFIQQLDSALRERARALEWFHREKPLSKKFQRLVTGFYTDLNCAIEATLNREKSGAPTTLRDARELVDKLNLFESELDLQLTHAHKHALALAFCMRDLCGDVLHYIQQIELTANVVCVENGKPKISNRPTNWFAKEALAGLVAEFQQDRGHEAWPKGSTMQVELQRLGFACSERVVRGWIRQMKSGSGGHLIQPRKDRQ